MNPERRGNHDGSPFNQCFRYRDSDCSCNGKMRTTVFYDWMTLNADILNNRVYPHEVQRPSLDTPGFWPLRYQQPM